MINIVRVAIFVNNHLSLEIAETTTKAGAIAPAFVVAVYCSLTTVLCFIPEYQTARDELLHRS